MKKDAFDALNGNHSCKTYIFRIELGNVQPVYTLQKKKKRIYKGILGILIHVF